MSDIETMVRQAYECFAKGDMDGLLAMFHDDAMFFVPGNVRTSGDHPKADFVEKIVMPVMEISGGTFREEILDMATGENFAAVMLDHTLERDGEKIKYHTIHAWYVRDGKFSQWWEFPHEYDQFARAWS